MSVDAPRRPVREAPTFPRGPARPTRTRTRQSAVCRGRPPHRLGNEKEETPYAHYNRALETASERAENVAPINAHYATVGSFRVRVHIRGRALAGKGRARARGCIERSERVLIRS